jgi:hypothetical protein
VSVGIIFTKLYLYLRCRYPLTRMTLKTYHPPLKEAASKLVSISLRTFLHSKRKEEENSKQAIVPLWIELWIEKPQIPPDIVRSELSRLREANRTEIGTTISPGQRRVCSAKSESTEQPRQSNSPRKSFNILQRQNTRAPVYVLQRPPHKPPNYR